MTSESSDALSTGAIVGLIATVATVLVLGLCLARRTVIRRIRVTFRTKRHRVHTPFRLNALEEPRIQVGGRARGPTRPALMSEIAPAVISVDDEVGSRCEPVDDDVPCEPVDYDVPQVSLIKV